MQMITNKIMYLNYLLITLCYFNCLFCLSHTIEFLNESELVYKLYDKCFTVHLIFELKFKYICLYVLIELILMLVKKL